MRILQVHNYYQQAGGEDAVVAEEKKLLISKGHSLFSFTLDNKQIGERSALSNGINTIWSNEAFQNITGIIREMRIDLVHLHNTFPMISPSAYYAASRLGVPVVQTLHNYRLLCPAATLYRQGQVCECCVGKAIPWESVTYKCYRNGMLSSMAVASMLTVHRALGTWSQKVSRYIALSHFAWGQFVAGGLNPDRIAVKPNFLMEDPGVACGGGGYALFVGRFAEEKGIVTLLDAWHRLSVPIPLKIIGDGPQRKLVEDASRLNPLVEYLGRRSQSEVRDFMGLAEFLIFPSTWYEGMPMTIIEALAKGTPVIASRLGTMQEMIREGENGCLFNSGDSDDLVRSILALFHDPLRRERLRLGARRDFVARYTPDVNYSRLMDIYQTAFETSKNRLG